MTLPKILFVLSEEQREQYKAELSELESPGMGEFVYQPDADEALDQVAELQPRLIVVGMEVGPMEGLEFLALLMKRVPAFDRPVVVLPAKGDPFPPVVHRRVRSSGRSETENIDLDGLRQLIAAAGEEEAPPAAPAPPPRDTGREFLSATEQMPAQKPRWPLFAIGGVVVIGAVLGVLLLRGGGEPSGAGGVDAQAKTVAGDAGSTPRADLQAAEPVASSADSEPVAARADASVAAATPPAEPPAAALRELSALPLRFAVGQADFEAEGALEAALRPYREALQQHPRVKLEVGGHTSDEGAASLNRRLGKGRARQVRVLLLKHGIPAARMITKNYGPTKPAASNDTPEGRQQNRRVTLRLVGE